MVAFASRVALAGRVGYQDLSFAARTLARFVAAVLAFGVAAELAAFVLPAAILPAFDLRGLADGLTGALLVTAFLFAAVFAVAGGFRVVEAADLAAFFAVTLAMTGLVGFVGGEASAISMPNTSASSALSSTLPVAGRFLD